MSSTNSKPNQLLIAILKSQGKHNVIDLIKEQFGKTQLVPKDKPFTLIIPSDSATNKLSLESKSKLRYILKAHILMGNMEPAKIQSRFKSANNNHDFTFQFTSGGKTVMKDTNGNEFALVHVPKNKLPKTSANNFSVYKIISGMIDPKIKKKDGSKLSKHASVYGGADDRINHTRYRIHLGMINKFKLYLRSNCINPYTPAVAGLLKTLETNNKADECKKAAILMTNCTFSLFYILVQPFKTRGEHLISDESIELWKGMEYYPQDICKYFCDFVAKHAPGIYNNSSDLLQQANGLRQKFTLVNSYKEQLDEMYGSFNYDGKNLISVQEKCYYDELKFKLCNIFCSIIRNNSEDMLLLHLEFIENIFPCNDELSEAKFSDPSYKETLRRDELLAPVSIYKFVQSTDFLGLFYKPDVVRSFENITSNAAEINLEQKKVFNAEEYRRQVLAKDTEAIRQVWEYNKKIYC